MTTSASRADRPGRARPDVVVRSARVEDAAGLARVHTLSWRETYDGLLPGEFLAGRTIGPAVWVERLAAPVTTLVAVDGKQTVVGFATVGWADDPAAQGTAQLYAIYLLAEWWGRGVGHRLHEASLTAMPAGADRAVVWVLDSNRRARLFYEREGWRLDGASQTDRFGAAEVVELRMSRPLPGAGS